MRRTLSKISQGADSLFVREAKTTRPEALQTPIGLFIAECDYERIVRVKRRNEGLSHQIYCDNEWKG